MTTFEEAKKGIKMWCAGSQKIAEDFIDLASPENKEIITISLFDEFKLKGDDDEEDGHGSRCFALKASFAMLKLIALTPSKTLVLFIRKETNYRPMTIENLQEEEK